MHSITSHAAGGSCSRLVSDGYSSPLRRLASRLASAWRHHRAELELEGLPFDLRKDIGYPSADEDMELTGNSRMPH